MVCPALERYMGASLKGEFKAAEARRKARDARHAQAVEVGRRCTSPRTRARAGRRALEAGHSWRLGAAGAGCRCSRGTCSLRHRCSQPPSLCSAPGLSRGALRRVRRRLHWQAWATDAVLCLNDISGYGDHSGCLGESAAQRSCLDRLAQTFRELPPPDAHINSAGALRALCGSNPGYTAEELPCATSNRELVSPPPEGMRFATIDGAVTGDDLDFWMSWRSRMLRSPGEVEVLRQPLGLVQPSSDPFVRRGKEYGGCLDDLARRRLVSFGREKPASVGVFFVPQKDGRLRLIMQTRMANTLFVDPPYTELPTSTAFARLERSGEGPLGRHPWLTVGRIAGRHQPQRAEDVEASRRDPGAPQARPARLGCRSFASWAK